MILLFYFIGLIACILITVYFTRYIFRVDNINNKLEAIAENTTMQNEILRQQLQNQNILITTSLQGCKIALTNKFTKKVAVIEPSELNNYNLNEYTIDILKK